MRDPIHEHPSRKETMLEFLKLLRDKYGGPEGYAKRYCGLTEEDVQTIKHNLVISQQ